MFVTRGIAVNIYEEFIYLIIDLKLCYAKIINGNTIFHHLALLKKDEKKIKKAL